ncbi:hypothetical protein GCM10023108_22590 [Saccharopolyspora hordei]
MELDRETKDLDKQLTERFGGHPHAPSRQLRFATVLAPAAAARAGDRHQQVIARMFCDDPRGAGYLGIAA